MELTSLLPVLASVPLVGGIKRAIQKWEKHRKDRARKSTPQEANGIPIPGALDSEEIARAVSATIPIDRIAMALVPTEIWRLIIYHATESYPTPFSVRDLHVASPTANLSEQELYPSYRQSIHTKLALSRVCQAWKMLTKEFLFEFVWITSVEDANALGRLLMDEADAGRMGAESSGWWIRRLWLNVFPRHDPPCPIHDHGVRMQEAELECNYPPLISKCPRLLDYRHRASSKILSDICVATLEGLVCQSPQALSELPNKHPLDAVTADHNLSLPFTPDIASQNHKDGLIWLDWSDSHPRSLATHLERHSDLLSHSIFASLQSLTIRALSRIPPRTKEKGKCIVLLPKLHTLRVTDPNGLADPADWELPALRSLYVVETDVGVNYLGPFLRVHGAKIETLGIQGLGGRSRNAPQLDVAVMCPNLAALHISFKDLRDWSANRTLWGQTSPSSIKQLGLFGLEDNAVQLGSTGPRVVGRFCEMNWEGILPALKILKDTSIKSDRLRRRALEHPDSPEGGPRVAFWKMFVRVLGDKGVTLLDWDDSPVVI